VLQLLAAMEKSLGDQGHRVSPGAGVGAALGVYIKAETPALAAR